jgi:hypothetical protein
MVPSQQVEPLQNVSLRPQQCPPQDSANPQEP